jgi:hypothetical protein
MIPALRAAVEGLRAEKQRFNQGGVKLTPFVSFMRGSLQTVIDNYEEMERIGSTRFSPVQLRCFLDARGLMRKIFDDLSQLSEGVLQVLAAAAENKVNENECNSQMAALTSNSRALSEDLLDGMKLLLRLFASVEQTTGRREREEEPVQPVQQQQQQQNKNQSSAPRIVIVSQMPTNPRDLLAYIRQIYEEYNQQVNDPNMSENFKKRVGEESMKLLYKLDELIDLESDLKPERKKLVQDIQQMQDLINGRNH